MEFGGHKTKIEAHSIFSIEGVQKILKKPMGTYRVQLIYDTKVNLTNKIKY